MRAIDDVLSRSTRRQADALRRQLLSSYSIEATPKQLRAIDHFVDQVPPWTQVYIPSLPSSVLEDRIEGCRTLAEAGLRPVPHIGARSMAGREILHEALTGFVDAGVEAILLVAGDHSEPAGPFKSTFDIIETGLIEGSGIKQVGVAGHPEGHPFADQDALDAALQRKQAYATATGIEMWLVTQFVFETKAIKALDRRLRETGIGLPIRVGIPGPAKMRTVISYALQCGIGASARALSRKPSAMKLLGRWTPDDITADLARYLADEPESLIQGAHFFPFGGVRAALDWIKDAEAQSGFDPQYEDR